MPQQRVGKLIAVGIDPSLAATGIATVDFGVLGGEAVGFRLVGYRVARTVKGPIGPRLLQIVNEIEAAFVDATMHPCVVGIENLSRGSKFMREEMGMAHACAQIAAHQSTGAHHVTLVTPQAAKAVACPAWPGFTKANWAAAGYTTKFKRSMPDKEDVMNGLFRRFKINVSEDAVADATCVAIAAAYKFASSIR